MTACFTSGSLGLHILDTPDGLSPSAGGTIQPSFAILPGSGIGKRGCESISSGNEATALPGNSVALNVHVTPPECAVTCGAPNSPVLCCPSDRLTG